MKPRTSLPTEHRLARLAAWAMAALAWLLLSAPPRTPAQYRHQQRFARVTIRAVQRFITSLIIIRAAHLLPLRTSRQRLNHARHGFTRRIGGHITNRRIAGVWLRRRLTARGSISEQFAHLLELMRAWRALGAELARRRAKRLTRLFPLVIARPAADTLRTLAAPPAYAADSS